MKTLTLDQITDAIIRESERQTRFAQWQIESDKCGGRDFEAQAEEDARSALAEDDFDKLEESALKVRWCRGIID